MSKEVKTLEVTSADQAAELLRRALDGAFSADESVLIKFSDWPSFKLNVSGPRYHQTVPTQLMRALVEFQHVLNQIHAGNVYGSSSRAFTEEERFANELVFKVDEGSSDFWASLTENLNSIASKLVDKMTGKQLVVTVLGLALIASGYFGFKNLLDHNSQDVSEINRHQLEMRLLEENAASRHANDALTQNVLSIVKSVPDATHVSVGAQEFDRSDVEALNRKSRDSWNPQRVDAKYLVVGLRSLKDRWTIQLLDQTNDRQIRTDLFRGEKASAAIEEISQAFAKGEPLQLYIIARVRGDQISQATILGTEKTGLGIAHVETTPVLPDDGDLASSDDQP
ncbi:hypothetical protein [Luteibacter sp. E-22]|uniref:hypothetical protein n=1 Tax=Luteibacter sp. E-22 TaxID=3404050 RepID=UPI003CEFB740